MSSSKHDEEEKNISIVLNNLKGTQSDNKYTNKSGYSSALFSAFLYAFCTSSDGFIDFWANFGAILIAGNILAFCISFFWKLKNFGKVLGVVCFLFCLLGLIGQRI